MGISDAGNLSLAQFFEIREQWNKAHGDNKVEPPTDEEFEQAILAVRGAVH